MDRQKDWTLNKSVGDARRSSFPAAYSLRNPPDLDTDLKRRTTADAAIHHLLRRHSASERRLRRHGGTVPSAVDPIISAAKELYEPTRQSLVITSATDGEHMEGSLHYEGKALDLRIWNLPSPAETAEQLQRELGSEYDVIYGPPNHDTHIHVEYDPS